jgi:hypothetical protein
MSPAELRPAPLAGRAALLIAALVAAASLGGIFVPASYAQETASWRVQGMAQDWVDVLVAAPWLAAAGVLTLRRSRRGALLLAGALVYTAYAFAIYAFAMHFNALFLVYVALLSLSAFALADLARVLGRAPASEWFDERAPRRLAGSAMMVLGLVFAVLWLAQIVPATVRGTAPSSLAEVGLITNPVHVLDLAFIVPLLVLSGHRLRRGRDSGYVLGTILLGFSVLMSLAILVMSIQLHRHDLAPDASLVAVFAVTTLFFATLLAVMLRSLSRPPPRLARPLRPLLRRPRRRATAGSPDTRGRRS